MGLALIFSSLSFASDYMDLYTKPVVKSEVRDEIRGGNIETNFMGFYTTPKEATTTASPVTEKQKTNGGYISVFGVQISLNK